MADWETEESRCAINDMTELERVSGPRIVAGFYRVGEAEDDRA